MSYYRGIATGVCATLLALAVALGVWRLAEPVKPQSASPKVAESPAKVPQPLKEDQITTMTLTPQAIDRLALRTAKVKRTRLRRSRTYGGEITTPSGGAIVVSAPLAGVLRAPVEGLPQPGQNVRRGQLIFKILPLLTPEGRVTLSTAKVEADGQVEAAQSQLDAAEIALNRARRLLEGQAGSRKAVDETQAQFDLAQKAFETATARRAVLGAALEEFDRGTASPLNIQSPQDGFLKSILARPDQNVPAGGPLFEVDNLQRVWVRVPVYVGELPELAAQAPARILSLTAKPGEAGRSAVRVPAPPSANPAAGTVDLFFELENAQGEYSPGQRVAAALALSSQELALTAPWPAIVIDIYGGAWAYEQTGELTFVRRRVLVQDVVDGQAVLGSGPPQGARIVVAGAAELFGAETGFSK